MQMPSLVDIALVYALLAATAMVVFVQRQWRPEEHPEDVHDESN
jgi:hypothetical protein